MHRIPASMKAKRTYHVREYGYLLEGLTHDVYPNAEGIPKSAFQYLLSFIQYEAVEKDFAPFLRLTTFKRKTALKVLNYVGVLQTPCGTQIEVLPKLYLNGDTESAEATRNQLITMLRCLRDSPFKQAGSLSKRATNMPLLEVYISQFLALTNQRHRRQLS